MFEKSLTNLFLESSLLFHPVLYLMFFMHNRQIPFPSFYHSKTQISRFIQIHLIILAIFRHSIETKNFILAKILKHKPLFIVQYCIFPRLEMHIPG